jgi:hypothetical protein
MEEGRGPERAYPQNTTWSKAHHRKEKYFINAQAIQNNTCAGKKRKIKVEGEKGIQ